MATVTNLVQYFINGAMKGFTGIVVPLNAFSFSPLQRGAALNDVVRVPFASATTASAAFTYAGGYTGNNGGINGKSVTLSTLVYQPLQYTDSELAVLSPEALTLQGEVLGKKLAYDFISSSLANVTTGNFGNASTYPATGFSSSAALVALDDKANGLNWTDGNRHIVAGTTLWNAMLSNTLVQQSYAFGGSEAVRNGQIPSFFGFTPHKTSIMTGAVKGFACTPNALVVAMAYHKPADGHNYNTVQEIRDPASGIILGYREWYDSSKATLNRVIEVLGGTAVGDAAALVTIA